MSSAKDLEAPPPPKETSWDLANINETKDASRWAALGGVSGVAEALHTSLTEGLDASSVAKHGEMYGANTFKQRPPKSFLRLWFNNLKDVTLIMLMVAALVSTVFGVALPEEREDHAWSEGVAIWCAVLVVSLVGAFNDWDKDRKFKSLNAQKDVISVQVIRDGTPVTVLNREVVVGDMLLINTGDKIVADCYVTRADDLVVDEACLTGESCPVPKDPKDNPWLRSGTQVKEGSGRALVIAVGEKSDWGRILNRVLTEPEDTPLQKDLAKLARIIAYVGGSAAVVAFLVLLIRWCVSEGGFPLSKFSEGPLQFFIFAVTILVVAIPEGLPLAVTISLAYSMKKMFKDNNFVRVMAACETMGGATTICSDKTGTLTMNRMSVVKIYMCGAEHGRDFLISIGDNDNAPTPAHVALNVALNSKAFLKEQEDGRVEFNGNSTECALLMMTRGKHADYEYPLIRNLYSESCLKVYNFSSARKMSSVLVRFDDVARLYTKGAAEIVLGRCTRYAGLDGEADLDANKRTELNALIARYAGQGLRTICLAHRDLALTSCPPEDPPEDNLVLDCVVGIEDPVRDEVPGAVALCKDAGITVRMVTGDNLWTALSIARQCGIVADQHSICTAKASFHPDNKLDIVMEGPDFRQLSEHQRLAVLPRLRVLARSSPDDKFLMVEGLKQLGEVVAVTGDGTNDAPALKTADVGLAMGIAGTEVAKEAADIVILDDNFNSVVKAVMWGRSVLANIRKFLQFQLPINLTAMVVAVVACIFNGKTPLNVMQLLWVNLVMDSLAALALATQPPTPDLLERKPEGRKRSLISKPMYRFIVTSALYQIFWVSLIFYGAPAQLESYHVPSKCDYLKTLPGYCCAPGTPCNWQANETAACTVTASGACEIQEPRAACFCGEGVDECARYDEVSDAYDDVMRDYKEAEEDALMSVTSLVFNTFIWCQMFNMINARMINDELNVFAGLFKSTLFWAIWSLIAVIQVVIMFALGAVFKVERLGGLEWAVSILIGVGQLAVCAAVKLVSGLMSSKSVKSA